MYSIEFTITQTKINLPQDLGRVKKDETENATAQEFAAAIASGKQAGSIELLHYRLCGILPFQDMRSMYGRGVLFVPDTRCGGARKASTVWRQVATARGPEPGGRIGVRHL